MYMYIHLKNIIDEKLSICIMNRTQRYVDAYWYICF